MKVTLTEAQIETIKEALNARAKEMEENLEDSLFPEDHPGYQDELSRCDALIEMFEMGAASCS